MGVISELKIFHILSNRDGGYKLTLPAERKIARFVLHLHLRSQDYYLSALLRYLPALKEALIGLQLAEAEAEAETGIENRTSIDALILRVLRDGLPSLVEAWYVMKHGRP
jgi:hypothetical protein